MVIKPSWGHGGKNVLLGKETSVSDWEKIISQRIGDQTWVVQEYVPLPSIPIPVPKKKKIVVRKKYFNLGCFVINNRFAGLLGRVSEAPIINIEAGGAILPILRY